MDVKFEMHPVSQILRAKGLTSDGSVQAFHTQNVLRRIVKYMPYRTGSTVKLTIAQTDINQPFILTDVPYGKYLYYGKVMEGPPPMVATDRDLEYSKHKHRKAGPYWDRALVAAEMPVMERELQAFINRRAGR